MKKRRQNFYRNFFVAPSKKINFLSKIVCYCCCYNNRIICKRMSFPFKFRSREREIESCISANTQIHIHPHLHPHPPVDATSPTNFILPLFLFVFLIQMTKNLNCLSIGNKTMTNMDWINTFVVVIVVVWLLIFKFDVFEIVVFQLTLLPHLQNAHNRQRKHFYSNCKII